LNRNYLKDVTESYPDYKLSYQCVHLCHYGIEQRWLTVYSKAAWELAEKTLAKAQAKELNKVTKQLFHLQAQRFSSKEVAQAALDKMTKPT
jgi:DNA-binding transcriptional regulator/RsmH inhibitor MraZ